MSETKIKRKAPVGATLIVVSSFFYASYGIWTKLLGDYFDGFTASALRSVLVLLMLAPIAIIYRKFEPINIKQNWPYIIGMLIASLFTWGPLYYAILNAGVGISLAVAYASIVIGMFFFGRIFGKERLTRLKLFSAVLGIIGIGLIFVPGVSSFGWLALLAGVVSGLSSAANSVFAKHIHYGATQSTILLWVTSIISNFFMAILLTKSFPKFSFDIEWLYLIIFAVASVIASWTFVRGVKLIDAGTAGILGLLEIVFGVLFGIIFFHEHQTILALVGMTVIIFAAALPYIRTSEKRTA